MAKPPIAVIDVGSNSARVVVFRQNSGGVLEVVADQHVSLQLIREVREHGKLTQPAIDRTLRVLKDFRFMAESAGARKILAFGTAALREAANGDEFRARVQADCAIRLDIMGPEAEGQAGFLGAVYGLPVRDGLVFDIGGGSLQVTHYRNRNRRRTCSLPLGALRVSDDFLASDPPGNGQVRRLREHIAAMFSEAGIPRLQAGEAVVGTGGTVRNLAKIDSRSRDYPIPRLHGYELTRRRLDEITAMLLAKTIEERASISGLNTSRADSIVGGCLVAEAVLEISHSDRLLVAGQGLREGIVLGSVLGDLPQPKEVRAQSVEGLAARFQCDADRTARRRELALSLYDRLEPFPDLLMREMLEHATSLIEIGRSVDYYRLHEHTASIVRVSALLGFSHREVALLSSLIEMADRSGWDPRRCAPPLEKNDFDQLERAGVLMALAEAIEQRRPPGPASPATGRMRGEAFVLDEDVLQAWEDSRLESRFRKAFDKELRVRGR